MNSLLRIFAATLTLLFVAGCGQSGPLYIPGDPSTVQPPAEQQETGNEDEDDAEENAGE